MSKPKVSSEEAAQLLRELYGYIVLRTEPLVSYNDCNFRIECNQPGPSGENFCTLLKISGCDERNTASRLGLHNEIMQFLFNRNIRVQRPLVSLRKQWVEQAAFYVQGNGPALQRTHFLRLFSYIEGITWSGMLPLDLSTYKRMGAFLCKLHLNLKKFLQDKNFECSNELLGEHDWSISRSHLAVKFMDCVKEPGQRQLACEIWQHFRDNFAERLNVPNWDHERDDSQFPITLIHGDLNHMNILIDSKAAGNDREFGIIDWEHCAISRRIYDVAIMLTYMLICENPAGCHQIGREILLGFQQVAEANRDGLTREELRVLPYLVAARFVQSLVIGAYTYPKNPSENAYCLDTEQRNGWEKIHSFWTSISTYSAAWDLYLNV